MIVFRAIGWLLVLAALAALGWDIYLWIHEGHWAATPTGKVWYQISPGSLNLLQAVIERHIWKILWNPIVLTVLLQPLWLVLGIPGLLLALVPRPRKRRRFSRS